MKTDTIHEGMTMEYIPLGLLLCVLAGISTIIHPLFIIPTGAAAIAVFTISTGIEINHKSNQLRKYKSVFGYRWGQWRTMDSWVQAKLVLSIDNKDMPAQMVNSIDAMGGARQSSSIRTFDLVVNYKNGKFETINHFIKYSFALKTMKSLKKISSLTSINKVEERLIKQRQNRKR
ncbi:MAG: hypothetical protein ACI857_003269 [Arenicella sp.]|jgi:hypothetical protein